MNIFYFFKQRLRAFAQCEEGLAFVEFALAIPLLLILFYGAVEVSRYLLVIQKMEDMNFEVADVAAQLNPATANFQSDTCTRMANLTNAVKDLMSPYTDSTPGAVNSNVVVYISAVLADAAGDPPTIEWQYTGGGTYTPTTCNGSCIGTKGGNANFSPLGGLAMAAGTEIVVAEVFYKFTPIFSNDNMVAATELYRPYSELTRYYLEDGLSLAGFDPTACR